jgi:hypothetical protein
MLPPTELLPLGKIVALVSDGTEMGRLCSVLALWEQLRPFASGLPRSPKSPPSGSSTSCRTGSPGPASCLSTGPAASTPAGFSSFGGRRRSSRTIRGASCAASSTPTAGGLNHVTVKGRDYAYPRYQFSNRSDDIRALFTYAWDLVGIEWASLGPLAHLRGAARERGPPRRVRRSQDLAHLPLHPLRQKRLADLRVAAVARYQLLALQRLQRLLHR